MNIQPRIETFKSNTLIGMRKRMSFADNTTRALWQSFMPRRKEINDIKEGYLYSIEVYNNVTFFEAFDPKALFEKWAAVEVASIGAIPDGMETIVLPDGLYAVFIHRGPAGEGPKTYQYIFGTWLPGSEYVLEDRPHFALMGEKYAANDPDSEEEIWIPVRLKK